MESSSLKFYAVKIYPSSCNLCSFISSSSIICTAIPEILHLQHIILLLLNPTLSVIEMLIRSKKCSTGVFTSRSVCDVRVLTNVIGRYPTAIKVHNNQRKPFLQLHFSGMPMVLNGKAGS